MNCISLKIINQKLIINGVQSVLKNKQILHSSFRCNHVFTYRSNRKPIYNSSLIFNNVTLVRLASTHVQEHNNILGTESFDSFKDVSVTISNSDSIGLLSELPAEVISKVAEPTFTSLGLGGGTPWGLLQLGLEYMHVEWGVPWWATVIATTTILKLLMVPFVISCRRHHIGSQKIFPEMEVIQKRMDKAYMAGNEYEVELHRRELETFLKNNQINLWKPMLPALVQGFVFISFFWALNPLAQLPLESLKTGGILWFQDLTITDPYRIMPIFSGATVAYLITAANEAFKMSEINNLYLKVAVYMIPVTVIVFSCTFPSVVLLYWSTNNVFSIAQHFVFRTEAFQKYFDLPTAIKHSKKLPPI